MGLLQTVFDKSTVVAAELKKRVEDEGFKAQDILCQAVDEVEKNMQNHNDGLMKANLSGTGIVDVIAIGEVIAKLPQRAAKLAAKIKGRKQDKALKV